MEEDLVQATAEPAANGGSVTLSTEQVEMARHALGLDGRRKQTYRNHYCIDEGSDGYADWESMVSRGYATCRKAKKNSPLQWAGDFFHLTTKGALSVLRKGETLDPKDFPDARVTAEPSHSGTESVA